MENRLKEIRKACGLSQAQLSKLSGVHRVSIARYENGVISPSAKNLVRLAKALSVSMEEIMQKAG